MTLEKSLEKPLNRTDLVVLMAEDTGLSKRQSELSLNALLKILSDRLIQGGAIKLVNFGHFHIAERQARVGRNPFNGERVEIPAKRAIVFRAAVPMKKAVVAASNSPTS